MHLLVSVRNGCELSSLLSCIFFSFSSYTGVREQLDAQICRICFSPPALCPFLCTRTHAYTWSFKKLTKTSTFFCIITIPCSHQEIKCCYCNIIKHMIHSLISPIIVPKMFLIVFFFYLFQTRSQSKITHYYGCPAFCSPPSSTVASAHLVLFLVHDTDTSEERGRAGAWDTL